MSTKAKDKMKKLSEIPVLEETASLKKARDVMSQKRLGIACFVDNMGKLKGLLTDGDLRRMLEKNTTIDTLTAKDIMSPDPKTIDKEKLAVEAFNIMEENNITQIIVSDKNKYLGMVHLHDILKEGIV